MMYSKKTFFALMIAAAASSASIGSASDQFAAFSDLVDRGNLKPFARDLGGMLGSAAFHSGRSLGFSGFDIGAHGGMQFRPDSGDTILRNSGQHAFGVPWVQAEIGLPFRLDGFIRGISYQGLTISGGGLRLGLLKLSEKPWQPQVLLSTVGHSVVHQDFSASHFGANLVVSMGTEVWTPYVAVGIDRTRVVVRSSKLDPTMNGTDATTLESRFTAGISLRPTTFTYLQTALTLAHGYPGMDMGLGIRF